MSDTDAPAREAMEFDVVIVGAGPAGLAAAIRLKQLSPDVAVVVVEKGSEVGAHILSGAVIDPIGLDRLLPDWRGEDTPIKTKVTSDRFYLLGQSGALRLPNFLMPPLMNNHGNYVVSLGNVCRWLATKAEALGVEIYPGFAAAEVLYDANGAVAGVATGDMGIGKDGQPKDSFTRGMELRAKYTLFAEGARGSLTKPLLGRFGLDAGREPQKYGIGLKELWQVAPDKFHPGLVQHTFGWPLDNSTGGGSFLYHFDDNLVAVGFVVHLNYSNPYLAPFEEFQRFKTHPLVRDTFEGGKRLSLRRARDYRRRLPIGAEACVSGRGADRLRGRFRQRPAHQGQPQRHAVRHAGRRARRAGAVGRARQRRTCGLRGGLARLRYRARPLEGAQRQAALVAVRHAAGHRARRARHVEQYGGLLAVRHAASRQARFRHPEAGGEDARRSPIPSPTASSLSTGSRRCSSPTPITRRISRRISRWPTSRLQKASEHDVYAGRRRAIARPGSTSGWRRAARRVT